MRSNFDPSRSRFLSLSDRLLCGSCRGERTSGRAVRLSFFLAKYGRFVERTSNRTWYIYSRKVLCVDKNNDTPKKNVTRRTRILEKILLVEEGEAEESCLRFSLLLLSYSFANYPGLSKRTPAVHTTLRNVFCTRVTGKHIHTNTHTQIHTQTHTSRRRWVGETIFVRFRIDFLDK